MRKPSVVSIKLIKLWVAYSQENLKLCIFVNLPLYSYLFAFSYALYVKKSVHKSVHIANEKIITIIVGIVLFQKLD